MATRTINTKIQLDGEKEFKSAISEINSGLGVLNSEMKKVQSEFQDNADSVEALTKKGDVLERKLYSQKEKVETLRKALENAKTEYGEADARTMKWEKSLNEAEAQLYDTENAIKKNNEALEQSKKGTQVATVSFKDFAVGAAAAVGVVVAAVKGLIDLERDLIEITRDAASEADNILTLAQITGLDTNTIQELQYASELIDVSFETIKSSMTKMKRNMDSARDGNSALIESFESLGVSITNTDGTLRNSEDVFFDAIDALGGVQNATERDAIAMSIFGKSAEELNPLIVQGSAVLREYATEAHEVNAVLSEEQLAALGAVDDAYQRLTNTQKKIKEQMSAELAPAVEKLYTNWTKFIDDTGTMLIDSGILETLGDILEVVANLVPLVESIIRTLLPNLSGGIDDIASRVDNFNLRLVSLIDALNTLINPIGSIIRLLKTGTYVDTSFTTAYKQSRYVTGNSLNENGYYTGNFVGGGEIAGYDGLYNASGDMNFRGGLTWVGENGPELVSLPAGSSISTAQDSRNMGTNNYYITIDAKNVQEFNDIVAMAQSSRVASRMRG